MKIVWDEPKRVANLRQHGLDFADVEQHLEWDSAVYFETYPSRRIGRERLKALAAMNGTLVKAGGAGWQTRINDTLRHAAKNLT